MAQRIENYSGFVTAPAAHLYYTRKTLAVNKGATLVEQFTEGAAHGVSGGAAFSGGCNLGDSRKMVFAPSSSTGVGLYDPENGTLVNTAVHGEASAAAFLGAASVRSNLVVLAPHNSAHVGLYNPQTNQYTRGPAHGKSVSAFSGAHYIGANAAGEDIVILLPRDAGCIGIYNATRNTYSDGAAFASCRGGRLLPDGRIFITPTANTTNYLYDPKTNAVTALDSTSGNGGAVLLLDGSGVAEVPFGASRVFQTNLPDLVRHVPLSNQFSPTGTQKYFGGAPALNGEIVFPPHSRGTVCIYTPPNAANSSGIIREVGAFPTTNPQYIGALPAYDGKIIFIPAYAAKVGIWNHCTIAGGSAPEIAMRSPYFGASH